MGKKVGVASQEYQKYRVHLVNKHFSFKNVSVLLKLIDYSKQTAQESLHNGGNFFFFFETLSS